MNHLLSRAYVRPETFVLECEYGVCQNSTFTFDFEDGGAIYGEWK